MVSHIRWRRGTESSMVWAAVLRVMTEMAWERA